MCLIINSIHYNRRNEIKPFEARKNILVYKRLIIDEYGQLITPYRCYPINFKDGICELQAEFEIWRNEVSQGIHAYTIPNTRENGCYNAVIPKGTKFFIGWNNDIVAERLIIYANDAPSDVVPISKYKLRKYSILDFLTSIISVESLKKLLGFKENS